MVQVDEAATVGCDCWVTEEPEATVTSVSMGSGVLRSCSMVVDRGDT